MDGDFLGRKLQTHHLRSNTRIQKNTHTLFSEYCTPGSVQLATFRSRVPEGPQLCCQEVLNVKLQEAGVARPRRQGCRPTSGLGRRITLESKQANSLAKLHTAHLGVIVSALSGLTNSLQYRDHRLTTFVDFCGVSCRACGRFAWICTQTTSTSWLKSPLYATGPTFKLINREFQISAPLIWKD